MFDPNITEGTWVYRCDQEYVSVSSLVKIQSNGLEELIMKRSPGFYNKDNAKAIAAVPQLLKVLEAARKVVDEIDHGRAVSYLYDAIENLDEMHCNV